MSVAAHRPGSSVQAQVEGFEADPQAASDGINSLQGTIWTPCDFPAQLDQDLPITYGGYQSLKQHLLGKRVKTRDARVTDALLKSWGMTSWKQYVLDQYLSTY